MKIYVREYSWMWNDLHLSLAECRVYAYIYGLTHGDKGGYEGSKRGLAKALGLSEASVRNILDTLTDKSLISYTNGLWQSVSRAAEDSAQPLRSSAQPLRESAQPVRENAQPLRSPHTPLYNNNKTMERNDKIARDTIATPNPLDLPSFEDLEILYKQRSANAAKITDEDRTRCRSIWDNYPDWKRKLLIEQLSDQNGWCKPRFDWTLADFDPKPTNYRGQEQPRDKPIFSAKFNGEWGMYTEADIVTFNMERAPKPKVKIKGPSPA